MKTLTHKEKVIFTSKPLFFKGNPTIYSNDFMDLNHPTVSTFKMASRGQYHLEYN